MTPNRLVVRAYALRAFRLWLGARGVLSLSLLLAEVNPLALGIDAIFWSIVFSVGVCFLDIRRQRERALLGNLAVSPVFLAALFAAVAVGGEALLLPLRGFFA
jgi:hypothetical protein